MNLKMVNSSIVNDQINLIDSNGLLNVTSSNVLDQNDMSVEKVFSIIVQCFGLIITGYLFGRLNLITQEQSKGISAFTSRICKYKFIIRIMIY